MPATQIDRIDGFTTSVALKAPVRVVATSPITFLGTAPYGYQTIDGVAVSDNISTPDLFPDRVLLVGQSDTRQNGIWQVSSLAWTRALDFDGARDAVKGTMVYVNEGTLFANSTWKLTTANPVVFGTSNITFVLVFVPLTSSPNGPISWVASLAALRAISLITDGTVIYLEGTSAPGDGVQGYFRYNAASTAADDGGQTAVTPTGFATGRWLRLPLGWTYGGMTNAGGGLFVGTLSTATLNGNTVGRQDAQLEIQNKTSGHTLFSLVNNLPTTEEAAISWESYFSNAAATQQAATFVRWVNGANDSVTGVSVHGTHVVGGGGADNTAMMLFSDNSAVVCAGATSGIPWNSSHLAGWFDAKGTGSLLRNKCYVLAAGQSHNPVDAGAQTLDVTGSFRVGVVDGSFNSAQGVEAGYSGGNSAGYVQGFNRSGAAFIPLLISGSTLTLLAGATPAAAISIASTQALQFNHYGAGTLTSDASGNVTVTSDLRKKTAIETYRSGLLNVLRVKPITYTWSKDSGYDRTNRYSGFGAQHLVKAGVENAARLDKDGFYTLDDRAMIATLWNAVRTLGYLLGATWIAAGVALVVHLA